jgi:hypothetical protein
MLPKASSLQQTHGSSVQPNDIPLQLLQALLIKAQSTLKQQSRLAGVAVQVSSCCCCRRLCCLLRCCWLQTPQSEG